jgi:hypothetical protein
VTYLASLPFKSKRQASSLLENLKISARLHKNVFHLRRPSLLALFTVAEFERLWDHVRNLVSS